MRVCWSRGIPDLRVLPVGGLIILALSMGAGLSSCKSVAIDPSPRGVYQARCQRCHEVDGSSTTASKLADEEIDLRDRAFQNGITDERMRRIARYGVGKMQGVAGITDEQLDSVVVFVRSLRLDTSGKASRGRPSDASSDELRKLPAGEPRNPPADPSQDAQ